MDEITAADLLQHLRSLPANTKVNFHGGLSFYRVKWIADDEVLFEFSNIEAELSAQFRAKHPEVIVAFCETPSVDAGKSVQEFRVPRL